jgi:hypothetical protein
VPTAGANTTISYVYTSGNSTLTRTDATGAISLLKNIDTSAANGFNYYDESGTATTSVPSLKQINFNFTTKAGNAAVGTESSYVIVSPRVALRNKPLLL